MPTVEETPCPCCGEKTLKVEERLVVKPPGTHSLAGVQIKLAAVSRLFWKCTHCGEGGPADAA